MQNVWFWLATPMDMVLGMRFSLPLLLLETPEGWLAY